MSPCSEQCVGAVSLIRYARKPRLDHLDDLLHERAHWPLRIRDSPLRHHLPFLEAPETGAPPGRPFRGPAPSDDATADLQRSLRRGAAPALGERDRLPEGPAPHPGAGRFHRRYEGADGVLRGEIAGPRV